ncbi:MAG TPA: NADH-quinone oxidoreductase subunit C [Propionibacteriaceae bacterium]
MRTVPPESWLDAVRQAKSEGYRYFDWLGCVDQIGRSDTFTVVLVLRDLDAPTAEPLTLSTDVPRDQSQLDSIGSVFRGAGWHERESAELFGIEFVGGDPRRLLLDPGFTGTPLRKDEVLGARAAESWPGAREPGDSSGAPSRRRTSPPGVPDPAVWGSRDPESLPADPAEVAESAASGRARPRSR